LFEWLISLRLREWMRYIPLLIDLIVSNLLRGVP